MNGVNGLHGATSLPHSQLLIVADDLTGAADSAARARRMGLAAEVAVETANGKTVGLAKLTSDSTATVLALNTDSRHLPSAEAATRVGNVIATVARNAGERQPIWYKKIDSTLRGNLGSELEAMLGALPQVQAALICPVFPAQGRGLEDGYLVHSTLPARTLHLPSLLQAQTKLPVVALELATVRGGALAQAVTQAQASGVRLIVVDALTDEDLASIMAATQVANLLLCGSAGLVAPLAAILQPQAAPNSPAAARLPVGPVLFVVGSGSATAHRQVARLVDGGQVRVRTLDQSWHTVDLIGAESHPQGDWLINLGLPPADAVLDGPAARARAAQLADLTHAVIRRLQPGALVIVGGDTAYYVLRALGIQRLTIEDELLPGVPLAVGVDGQGATRTIVLKAGSFGDVTTLATIYEGLCQSRPVVVGQ